MKFLKKAFIPFMLCIAFLLIPTATVRSAEIQAAYTKISDDLLSAYSSKNSNESMSVVVWLEDNATDVYQTIASNVPKPQFENGNNSSGDYDIQTIAANNTLTEEERLAQIEEMQNYIMQKRQIAQAVYLESNTPIANQLSEIGEVTYISRYSSVIICDLTKSEAVDVAMKNNVLSLTNGEIKGKDYMVSSNQAFGIAYPHSLSVSGQGIKIGMIESGVPDLTQSCFNGIDNKITTDGNITEHASWVAAILVGNQYGIARGFSELYSFGVQDAQTEEDDEYRNGKFLEGVETLLSYGVNVINSSYGFEECDWADRDEYADWLDHIAYNHSVHFVVANGNNKNNPYRVSNIAMAYNVISVGAVTDNGTPTVYADDNRCHFSCFYGDTTSSHAYKPDLCAYGENIKIPNTNIYTSEEDGNSGTSASAPYVTGLVAVLCSLDPNLLVAQDQMKAILTASTVKAVHNYNTSNEEYRMYGAGIANAKNATFLIQAGTYQGGSITNSESRDYISLGTIPAGTTVTVSLSFLKRHKLLGNEHENINSSFVSTELPDLDIYIAPVIAMPSMQYSKTVYEDATAYNYIFRSITYTNNVEKVTFTTTVTDEYILTINKHIAHDAYEVLYGVAWQIKHNGMT